jgi:hypothetical protein
MSSGTIEIIPPQCAPRYGTEGLRDQWAAWRPAERLEFVEGLVALGWMPERQPDYESPIYPNFLALPGNPCYEGMTGNPGGGSPGNPMGQPFALSRYPSGLLDWLRDLWARLSDALRRALAAFTGPWLAILAALLVGGGILLASRDRKARA